MRKLFIKLAVVIAAFIVSVSLLCYYAASCGAPVFTQWENSCAVSLAVLLLAGELGEALFPEDTLFRKKVFRVISRVLFFAAVCIWFVCDLYRFGIAVSICAIIFIVSRIKKHHIRKHFDAYLQKQGIQKDSVRNTLIWFSPRLLLRDKLAWIIAAEFADTPDIHKFSIKDGAIITDI